MAKNQLIFTLGSARGKGISVFDTKDKRFARKKFSRLEEKTIFDRFHGKCKICGRRIEFRDGDVDHIRPVSKGGSNRGSNLQWLCHSCNQLKGNSKTNNQVRAIVFGKTRSRGKRQTRKKSENKSSSLLPTAFGDLKRTSFGFKV